MCTYVCEAYIVNTISAEGKLGQMYSVYRCTFMSASEPVVFGGGHLGATGVKFSETRCLKKGNLDRCHM